MAFLRNLNHRYDPSIGSVASVETQAKCFASSSSKGDFSTDKIFANFEPSERPFDLKCSLFRDASCVFLVVFVRR